MSKETREHLSALVDGEISRETSRFLVRRLGADNELRATWTRYHLVRDCLRHQDGSIAGEDLCARVSRALENEQPAERPANRATRWLKPAAGLAIAASVALMAVVAVGPGTPGPSQAPGDLSGTEQFTSPQGLAPAPVSSQASFSSSQPNAANTSRKMDSYLLRHYQATGATGGKGFVTFVPIVITGARDTAATEPGDDAENPENVKGEVSESQ